MLLSSSVTAFVHSSNSYVQLGVVLGGGNVPVNRTNANYTDYLIPIVANAAK